MQIHAVDTATIYSVAAASMAPAPLNAALLVMTISTGYFHSINLAQPATVSTCRLPPTPRHQQLHLLQRLSPFALGIGYVFVVVGGGAGRGRGQGVDVVEEFAVGHGGGRRRRRRRRRWEVVQVDGWR
jgi:hypothetical protein